MSSSVRTPIAMRLPFSAASVAVARARLRTWMSENGGSGESIEDARAIISELVANSVRHGRPLSDGSILVTWTPDVDGEVHVAVTDGGGSSRPRTMHAPATALAGRGMAIVEKLSLGWWTERSGSRSTVHALLRG